MPHFQVVIGGQWNNNAGSHGLAIGATLLSARARLHQADHLDLYAKHSQGGRDLLEIHHPHRQEGHPGHGRGDCRARPPTSKDPSYYSDWGYSREYTIEDMGVGECAGEVVPYVEAGPGRQASGEIFEAQVMLDEGNRGRPPASAPTAPCSAGGPGPGPREEQPALPNEPDEIAREFRTPTWSTPRFSGTSTRVGKFVAVLLQAPTRRRGRRAPKRRRRTSLFEEAQLFVDAAHQCYTKYGASLGAPAARVLPRTPPSCKPAVFRRPAPRAGEVHSGLSRLD